MFPSLALCLAASPLLQECDWGNAAAAPQALVEVQSVVIDDKLYMMGGFFSPSLKGTARTDVYDPSADTWTGLADMLTVVTHHTAAVDGQRIWCAGGFLGDNGGFVINAVQVYDLQNDQWSFGPPLPARRAGGAMVRLDRKLHYFGGFSTRRLNADDHFVLDLDNSAAGWDSQSYAPLPMGRGQLSAVVLDGFIYAIGGQFGHDLNPVDVDLVQRFDPSQNQWTQVASLPSPRSHFEASCFVYQGAIFVVGGRNNQSNGIEVIEDITRYDVLQDRWDHVGRLPVGLVGPSAKPIGDVLHVSGGGVTSNTPVAAHRTRAMLPNAGSQERINAGGPDLSLQQDWCLDTFFVSGLSKVDAGTPPIAGTQDPSLYHSQRTGCAGAGQGFAFWMATIA